MKPVSDLDIALDDFLMALTLDLPDAQSIEDPTTKDAERRWDNFMTLKATVRNFYLAYEN